MRSQVSSIGLAKTDKSESLWRIRLHCGRCMFDLWVRKIPWRRIYHTSILAWKIPRAEELDRLQSMGPHRVGYDWMTEHLRSNKGNKCPRAMEWPLRRVNWQYRSKLQADNVTLRNCSWSYTHSRVQGHMHCSPVCNSARQETLDIHHGGTGWVTFWW